MCFESCTMTAADMFGSGRGPVVIDDTPVGCGWSAGCRCAAAIVRARSDVGRGHARGHTSHPEVVLVVGTRPEAIKVAPLALALQGSQLQPFVVSTGQHRHLIDQVLTTFDLRPDLDLKLGRPRRTLASLTASALTAMVDQLQRRRPEAVVVQGDTNHGVRCRAGRLLHRRSAGPPRSRVAQWRPAQPLPGRGQSAPDRGHRRSPLSRLAGPGESAGHWGRPSHHRGHRQHRHRCPAPGRAAAPSPSATPCSAVSRPIRVGSSWSPCIGANRGVPRCARRCRDWPR